MTGTLYIVATPIGNLGDISQRAIETLKEVAAVACEDTRHTGMLLQHLQIRKQLISYHQHNEARRSPEILAKLQGGENIALVSDAGTPLISDPGYRLMRLCIDSGITVTSIPGPVALINALVLSGLASHSFYFGGFLPVKSGQRKNKFKKLGELDATLIFYESPHRLLKSLQDIQEVFPEREVVLVKEMTKKFERCYRGKASQIITELSNNSVKGEFVVLIAGC